MFDFNTPIVKDTHLKAQYICPMTTLLTYDGEWARVTTTDGVVGEIPDDIRFQQFCTGSPVVVNLAEGGTATFSASQIAKVEFGTMVEALPNNSFRSSQFPNLQEINGFHDGFTQLGKSSFRGIVGSNFNYPITGVVRLPGGTLLNDYSFCDVPDFRAKVYFSRSNISFSYEPDTVFSNTDSTAPTYINGISIGGGGATKMATVFPNMNGSYYRNIRWENGADAFHEALVIGYASEIYALGSVFAVPTFTLGTSTYVYTNVEWQVMEYGNAILENGKTQSGAFLMMNRRCSDIDAPFTQTNPEIEGGTSTTYPGSWDENRINYTATTLATSVGGHAVPIKRDFITDTTTSPVTTSSLTATFWPPSVVEVMGVVGEEGAPGHPFAYLEQVIGTPANGNRNIRAPKRLTNESETSEIYTGNWLRDTYNSEEAWAILTNGGVAHVPNTQSVNLGPRVCCFIPDGTAPRDV